MLAMVANVQVLSAQDGNSSPLASESVASPPGLYQDIAQFGGPSSVGGQLAEDNNVDVPQFRCLGCNAILSHGSNLKSVWTSRVVCN